MKHLTIFLCLILFSESSFSRNTLEIQGPELEEIKKETISVVDAFEVFKKTKHDWKWFHNEHVLFFSASSGNPVFKLKKFPEFFIKMRGEERYNNIARTLEIIHRFNLDHIIIPHSLLIKVSGFHSNPSESISVAIEESIETRKAGGCYFDKNAVKNPRRREEAEKLFAQLARFMGETRYWDAHSGNIMLNKDKTSFVIVDLEEMFQTQTDLFKGIIKVLPNIHPIFHEEFLLHIAETQNMSVSQLKTHVSETCATAMQKKCHSINDLYGKAWAECAANEEL